MESGYYKIDFQMFGLKVGLLMNSNKPNEPNNDNNNMK